MAVSLASSLARPGLQRRQTCCWHCLRCPAVSLQLASLHVEFEAAGDGARIDEFLDLQGQNCTINEQNSGLDGLSLDPVETPQG
mmetsp:Transcript_5170/g.10726  ORF Transcript_5170/g.10726 Transcript_5170/m.10726 type:complete len:84 (+) Transcript_5170:437-688(+)